MISATPSGGWLQSSPAIPELGFPLGTRLQMFWLEEGLPSSLAPGKRPRTTLTPDPGPARRGSRSSPAAPPAGTSRSSGSCASCCATSSAGSSLQEAIDAPSWHTTAFPSSFYPRTSEPGVVVVEDRLGEALLAELRGRGHEVRAADPWSLGRLSAVSRDPGSGVLRAGANPRGMQGYAVGR